MNTKSSRTIYIAGAGIAGMTMALALAKNGIRAVILEKTPTLQPEGAGLQITPNAHHVLNQLGLSTALHGLGFAPQAIDIYPFKHKNPLKSLKLGPFARQKFGAPYIVIHRADLADILYRACQQSNLVEVHFSITDFDMITHARGLSVSREHSDGHIHEANPFAFIGADGVHSKTRTKFLSGPDALYSGYTAWRALIPTSMMKAALDLNHTSLLWGPGFHAIAYPHPKRHVINIALFSREKLGSNSGKKSVAPNLPEMALTCPRFKSIIEASEGGWSNWPLYAVKTGQWHKGAIGLIGDAAHAMLPFQAQGAAMAIEDAATLAPLLANAHNPHTAFAAYHAARKKRVKRVVAISASNGRIYHMGLPFSLARDLFVMAQGTKGHLSRLAWIYDHKISI